MVSIPKYEDLREIFVSENNALDWVVNRFSIRRYNSNFDNTNKSKREDHNIIDYNGEEHHGNEIMYHDETHQPDSTQASRKNSDTSSIGDDNSVGEKKSAADIKQKQDSIQTLKFHLLARSTLPCHIILLVSHLWLAGCSKESIAIITGSDRQTIDEWICVCIQSFRERYKEDISYLSEKDQIVIAERLWRRRNEEKLWDGFMETVIKPAFDTVILPDIEPVKQVVHVVEEEEESLVSKFEKLGLKSELMDGIVSVGVQEPYDVRKVSESI